MRVHASTEMLATKYRQGYEVSSALPLTFDTYVRMSIERCADLIQFLPESEIPMS